MFGIKTLTRKVDAIMATLADLTAALDANKAAVDRAIAKIGVLEAAVAIAQPVDLQPAVDAVNASTAALNAAAA